MTEPKRILIVDDEALARQRVARYVRQSRLEAGQEFLIEEAASGIEAVEIIQNFHPDIVFLDVEMPGLNGFEVLQQFGERPFHVIFTRSSTSATGGATTRPSAIFRSPGSLSGSTRRSFSN